VAYRLAPCRDHGTWPVPGRGGPLGAAPAPRV